MNPRLPLLVATLLLGSAAVPPPSVAPDTAAWWQTTRFLSSDSLEGRDTGSAGYERAARYVADRIGVEHVALGSDAAVLDTVMHEIAAARTAVKPH